MFQSPASMALECRQHSSGTHSVVLFDSIRLTMMLVSAAPDCQMDCEWVNWLLLKNFDFSFVVAFEELATAVQLGLPIVKKENCKIANRCEALCLIDLLGKIVQLLALVHLHCYCHLSVGPYSSFHASIPCNSVAAVAAMPVVPAETPAGMHLDPEVICLPSFLLLIDSALTVDLVDFAMRLARQLHCYSLDSKKQGTVYASMSR